MKDKTIVLNIQAELLVNFCQQFFAILLGHDLCYNENIINLRKVLIG
ncbi:hypothetical protein [Halanaerobium saccharolyticum]|jgi:hypothetical protein|nr:hypothetical protein [Halanaerobium saccharolyticum]